MRVISTRREALAGSGALSSTLGMLALTGPARAVAREPDGWWNDPTEVHVRMRADIRGRPVVWFFEGTLFGQLSGQRTRPLLGFEGISVIQSKRVAGGYLLALDEAGYFRDLESGAPIEEWDNPLTGETNRPENYRAPQLLYLTGEEVEAYHPQLPAGAEFVGKVLPPRRQGDMVWSSEDLFVRVPPVDGRPARPQTSLATLMADYRDLAQADDYFVPTTLSYQTIGSWRTWMDMAQPGVVSFRLFGRKHGSARHLTSERQERVMREHPDLLAGAGVTRLLEGDLAPRTLRAR